MQRRILAGAAACAAVAAALAVSLSGRVETPRHVVLEARGMAFYLPGGDAANPTIVAQPGELLQVTLRNSAQGLVHDFSVGSLGIAIGPIQAGATGSVLFRAPAAEGSYEYTCRPHALMMRGRLEVGPPAENPSPRSSESLQVRVAKHGSDAAQ